MGRKRKQDTALGRNDTNVAPIIAKCPFKVDEKVLASPKITGNDDWAEFTVGAIGVMPVSGLIITSYNQFGDIVMGSKSDYKKIKQ